MFKTALEGYPDVMERWFIAIIRVYRYWLSPWVGQACRFHPTCSNYAEQAIDRFGTIQGIGLTIRRLSKCHPWHGGGYDPVPSKD
jgi:putative membrane protein insertion efficiency factor